MGSEITTVTVDCSEGSTSTVEKEDGESLPIEAPRRLSPESAVPLSGGEGSPATGDTREGVAATRPRQRPRRTRNPGKIAVFTFYHLTIK